MVDTTKGDKAVGLLKELGLKEYEAKCFVALSRLPHGTAKEISEVSEVPRTRVYDAVKTLEDRGLVEIQHSNPQRFRAVSVDEAVNTLHRQYEDRTATLRDALRTLEPVSSDEEVEVTHEVWALSGRSATSSRTEELVGEAQEEIVLVIANESVFSDALADRLRVAQDRGVSVIVGTVDPTLRDTVKTELPDAEVFVSDLQWLVEAGFNGDQTEISRLLLVDRSSILAGTVIPTPNGEFDEHAVFGRGFDNGLVAIGRRLMATGLLPADDPGAASN